MTSIYHNLRTDRQYKAATALNKQQFEQLFAIFEPLYIPKTANPFITHNQPQLTDKREALFFVLHYLKAYPSLENLSLYFGFSQSTALAYLRLLMPLLKAALQTQAPLNGLIFKDQQAFEQAFGHLSEIILDVTEVSVERPVEPAKQTNRYSGKKSTHLQMVDCH